MLVFNGLFPAPRLHKSSRSPKSISKKYRIIQKLVSKWKTSKFNNIAGQLQKVEAIDTNNVLNGIFCQIRMMIHLTVLLKLCQLVCESNITQYSKQLYENNNRRNDKSLNTFIKTHFVA